MAATPTLILIRQILTERGVSRRSLATSLDVHPDYLKRVLSGGLRASASFLKAAEESARTLPGRVSRQQRVMRSIDAASHLFLIQRGIYNSTICSGNGRLRE